MRKGKLVEDMALYHEHYFNQPVMAAEMHQIFLQLLEETTIIYRLTGIRFFLMHHALLGWQRSRALLPWSRQLVLGMQDRDLVELQAFATWWKNDRATLLVNFLSARFACAPQKRLKKRRNKKKKNKNLKRWEEDK